MPTEVALTPPTLTARQGTEINPNAVPPGTVSLPGWRNIISIPGGAPPTKDEWRRYYQAQRTGRPPDLPPDRIAEIERRISIINSFKNSVTPSTGNAWTNILTWLDDTQDLFSLISIGGRLAARLAPKLLGRLIPGLGWVLLASDILKLLTMLSSIVQPFFVGLCHGWQKGVAAALPAALIGNAAKLLGHGWTGLNPFSRSAQLARVAKFGGKLFRVGEILEILQAMKTLTGYGLTLGAIMGTITQSAYALQLLLNGQPVDILVPGTTGTRIGLTTGTVYSSGSPQNLATLYSQIGAMTTNPIDRANANAHARALRQLGIV